MAIGDRLASGQLTGKDRAVNACMSRFRTEDLLLPAMRLSPNN